jgi:hypothetical protein
MSEAIEHRLARIEARLELADLVSRYARAADDRDIDTLVGLFVDDVDCGRLGRGHAALRESMTAMLRRFYRSIHFVCGQVIDELDADSARGTTYCRAEQEMGPRWVVLALRYSDSFARRDGRWLFTRRAPKLWYACDVRDRPWDGTEVAGAGLGFPTSLPQSRPTWGPFWARVDAGEIEQLTRAPR